MSHRWTNRRWSLDPLSLRGQIYGLKARLRELVAERQHLGARLLDLEGAHEALVTEVNTLREVVAIAQLRREALFAELCGARAINVTQARILAHQGAELVRAYEVLGVALHTVPADLVWAQEAVQAVIAPRGEGA